MYQTALILERVDDARAVRPLITALEDANPDRRRAAARALGWMRKAGTRAVIPLARVLTDTSQPVAVREEAAESLAYSHSKAAIPALISTLADPHVGVRFWSVFALGGASQFLKPGRPERRAAVEGLESILADDAAPPGNWWSVGHEALAMLAHYCPPERQFEDQLVIEIQRIKDDPAASPEDRRWADCYA
jgi:HEAT repeat protein